MDTRRPHYLLYSQANTRQQPGLWTVTLKDANGDVLFEASDAEPNTQGERLELLAVVRGLEALDRPARITLATPSRYVRRGLAYGLEEWKANNWSWEWFGRMVPIKNRDLWQRLDQALKYHEVQCRYWRIDPPQDWLRRPQAEQSTALEPQLVRQNSFDRATAQTSLTGPIAQKSRRNPTILPKRSHRPSARASGTKQGWISTCVHKVGLLLIRASGVQPLLHAGRLAAASRE